jgi:cytochrome c7-like protein
MTLAVSALGGACSASPAARSVAKPVDLSKPALGKRRTDIPADCEAQPGKPPPAPVRVQYTGVAKAARCQDEVLTIMGGITHFLGVPCKHCHQEPDYAADTHNKQVANWMARELVPRLRQRKDAAHPGGEVWCQDCHAGKPKLLGDPRRRDVAIEWMTIHLSEAFDTTAGTPPKCKDCHGGDLGSPAFRAKLILSEPAPALGGP